MQETKTRIIDFTNKIVIPIGGIAAIIYGTFIATDYKNNLENKLIDASHGQELKYIEFNKKLDAISSQLTIMNQYNIERLDSLKIYIDNEIVKYRMEQEIYNLKFQNLNPEIKFPHESK